MNWQAVRDFLSGFSMEFGSIAAGDIALWVLITALVLLGVRVVRRWIDRAIEDVNRRHRLRKGVGYLGTLVVLLVGLTLFVGRFAHLATILGLVGAGLAIALQDLGKSAAGWIYLSTRTGFGPGARVEVAGVTGEVIDVGILKTTLLEVGNIVYGRQSSGRLVTIPNSKFLSESVILNPSYSPFVWQELQFLLTYESDWRRGIELLEKFGREEFEEAEGATRGAFRELERRYAFRYGALTPIVYVKAADSGVEMTLRYLVHIRRRRGSADRVTRRMLEAVEREPRLDFAYPTMRIYRRGEGGDAGKPETPE